MGNLKSLARRAWEAITGLGPRIAKPMRRMPNTGSGDAPINSLPGIVGINPAVTQALQSAAVWACCRLISNSIATLPANLYKASETGKTKAFSHPLYGLLTNSPNPMMTLFQWLQSTVMNLLLWGNAFTFIDRIENDVIGLWPLSSSRVQIFLRQDGTFGYFYSDLRGTGRIYDSSEIIHQRLFTLDGYLGLPMIDYHRMTLDFESATTQYAMSIYNNGGQPGGVLEYPGVLRKEQVDRIRESWRKQHAGPANAGNISILEEGAKYTPIAIPLSQLNYIEEKKFSVEQIARLFGVPPHLIGADQKPTYASVEQQSIEFVQYTIAPLVISMEKSILKSLLDPPFSWRLNLAGFERGDIRTRYSSYATARQWGWMSANDIRELEDQNHIEGGDAYLTPLNMTTAGADGVASQPGEPQPVGENNNAS